MHKQLLRRIKRQVRVLAGRDFFEKPDVRVATDRFGSAYGGWTIVQGTIGPSSIVYSVGIGEDASFDIALIKRFGVRVHAFDPTPQSIEWVERQNFPSEFVMHPYGLAHFDGTVTFNPPENPRHVSHTMLDRPTTVDRAITVPVKRLATIMAELGHDRIDLLKIDIEGAEYRVVEDILDSQIRPPQFLVEYHHRFPGVGVGKSKASIAALRAAGYALFAVSPTGEEFSFVDRRRALAAA